MHDVPGIDLMNCPLNVVLQLRIKRKLPQGPLVPSLQAYPAFVSHLQTQARSVCVRRKILKVRDDIFEPRVKLKPTDSLAKWDATCNHTMFNEVQSDILSKYAPQVRAIINSES